MATASDRLRFGPRGALWWWLFRPLVAAVLIAALTGILLLRHVAASDELRRIDQANLQCSRFLLASAGTAAEVSASGLTIRRQIADDAPCPGWMALISASGTLITGNMPASEFAAHRDELVTDFRAPAPPPLVRTIEGASGALWRFAAERSNDSGTDPFIAIAGRPLPPRPRPSLTNPWTVGALVGLTGIAALLALVMSRAIGGPLRETSDAARRLAARARGEPVIGPLGAAVAGPGSVGLTVRAFNDLSLQVQQSLHTLERDQSRFQAVLAASTDPIIAVDAQGYVRFANAAAESWLGALDGRLLTAAMRNHAITEAVRRAQQDRQRAATTVELPTPVRIFAAIASPIASDDWSVLLLLHDITEARRAEAVRRDFVANVSHELRTPLAGIRAVVETLRDGALEDPVVAIEFLGRVETEVDRLVQLVEELLQLSRIESGAALHFAPTELPPLLRACLDRFRPQAERAGLELDLDVDEGLPPVRADAARLDQALGNLIHNALKFTDTGGYITVHAYRKGSSVALEVEDSGRGIDPLDLPRIFERFYTSDRARDRRAAGTGLGLAIVKHIALAHGGAVQVDSRLGGGSRFTITLPVAAG